MKRNLIVTFVLLGAFFLWLGWDHFNATLKPKTSLLIKFSITSNNPDQFFASLDTYYSLLSNEVPYHILVTGQKNDQSMSDPKVVEKLSGYPNLTYHTIESDSLIEAYNDGLDEFDFDIILAVGDDSIPVIKDYDKKIVELMYTKFPDLDGVLNGPDVFSSPECNTNPIIGKTYYNRFGLLFNPLYKSTYAKNEFTLISRILGKEAVISEIILKQAPHSSKEADDLVKQETALFNKRREADFDVETNFAKDLRFAKDWSIMICTLYEREEMFNKLYNDLNKQINDLNLSDKVEVIFIKDNREISIGQKRNDLIRMSKGRYINFVDDDDELHPQYIQMIYEKLKDNPDCVSLKGIITTKGKDPKLFVHSIEYNSVYDQIDGIYYRPPNHWNTIKKVIAAQFLFPHVNYGEDKAWTLDMARTKLLKKEAKVETPFYFYKYDGKYG